MGRVGAQAAGNQPEPGARGEAGPRHGGWPLHDEQDRAVRSAVRRGEAHRQLTRDAPDDVEDRALATGRRHDDGYRQEARPHEAPHGGAPVASTHALKSPTSNRALLLPNTSREPSSSALGGV